jgi:hypothetical protein
MTNSTDLSKRHGDTCDLCIVCLCIDTITKVV